MYRSKRIEVHFSPPNKMMVALPFSFGDSYSSPVFKCDMKLLALIVASVAASVVCTSSLRGAEYAAQEHRALVGHAIGNHSGVTRVRCTVLCLKEGEARCRSFNYDKTKRTCQLNGASMEEFPVHFIEDSDFTYYGVQLEKMGKEISSCGKNGDSEPQTTQDPSWQLVFKGVAGQGVKLYDMWTAPRWNESLSVGGSWRDDSLYGAWTSSELNITLVKLSLCNISNGCGAELIFNGIGSDVITWFSKDRLLESPWLDLPSTGTNVFSLPGKIKDYRRFFINHKYNYCIDDGWLVVTESDKRSAPAVVCEWELPSIDYPYPIILYSKTAGNVRWNKVTEGTGEVGRADYLTVHIKID